MTIRDQNCLVCVNLSQSQNLYVYWPDLTFLDQIWRFGTRIVDSTQTPNQQSGWSVFFPEWQSPFWRPESTKWVPESTKWVPESTKGDPESTKGDPESTKWESQKQQIGSRVLYAQGWYYEREDVDMIGKRGWSETFPVMGTKRDHGMGGSRHWGWSCQRAAAKGEEGRVILPAGPPLLHLRPLRLQFS